MKKFLLSILVTLAVLLPTIAVEAAYVHVPNFRSMASNKIQERIRFTGMNQLSANGVNYTRWNYICVDGKTSQYVNKYLKKLNGKHNISSVGSNGNNWYFVYSGSQAKYLNTFSGGFHIHVGVSGSNVVVDLVAGMYPE
ncbi:MAG: hypothetical protein IJU91_04550 [Selenomonadaceae bacterium]|nr:hypothetical protein [Selenomonadaceae bacterium]